MASRQRVALIASCLLVPIVIPSFAAAYRYPPLKCRKGLQWYAFGPKMLRRTEPVQRNANQTSRPQVARFVSRRSATVSRSISSSLTSEVGGGFGPFHASIKTDLGIDVTSEKTAELGNEQEVVVPARRAAVASYGVWTRTFEGVYLRRQRPHEWAPITPMPPPKNCPYAIIAWGSATFPLDEVGWLIRTERLNA